jgi:rare lipoprotein A
LVLAAIAAGTLSLSLSSHSSSPQETAAASSNAQSDRETLEQRASRGNPRSTAKAPTASKPSASSGPAAGTDDQDTQPVITGQNNSGSCLVGYTATGTTTASGAKFDPKAYTGANLTMPFGTKVRITNPSNGKSVVITINDRGPYSGRRCFDLTSSAFSEIASLSQSDVNIEWQIVS